MRRVLLLAPCVALVAACGDDPAAPKSVGFASPAELVEGLEGFYRDRDSEGFVDLLADDAANAAEYVFTPPIRTIERSWGAAEEAQIHRRMFDPANPAAGEPAVPHELWLAAIAISLEQVTAWEERPELYRSATNPGGLPPEKWKAVAARYSPFVFFDTQTDSDILVRGEAIFTVIEDLEKTGSEPGRFLLLRWQDVVRQTQIAGVESATWTDVKLRYRVVDGPASPEETVDRLETAYRERDRTAFARLLANDPDHAAEFVFLLASPVGGKSSWAYSEETRIHRRMFDPLDVEPGQPEVSPELWLQAIHIDLVRITDWEERPEFYRSDTNPNGLPPEKWRAVDARYATYVFFDTQTDSDFLVENEAIFTVIEDLEKTGAEPGRFLLLQWQDIDVNGVLKEASTWSAIKGLYR